MTMKESVILDFMQPTYFRFFVNKEESRGQGLQNRTCNSFHSSLEFRLHDATPPRGIANISNAKVLTGWSFPFFQAHFLLELLQNVDDCQYPAGCFAESHCSVTANSESAVPKWFPVLPPIPEEVSR